ncbi:MAG: zinc ABC transporter substrate-binding protein [Planctomycetota bacterium]|nr:MAG: zinc ABC transporter substrate-binding protein [Planctomycetota bacterium]
MRRTARTAWSPRCSTRTSSARTGTPSTSRSSAAMQLQRLLRALAAACALAVASHAADKLRVVTTLPDLADIARRIGGERVEVTALIKGTENLHAVVAKPSMLVALSRADVYVQVGLSLESSWAPGLLESARNAALAPGKPGFVNGSDGWEALDVPADLSRKGGDLHPQGNPHLNLSPRGGRHLAARILAGLVANDPAGRAAYEKAHAAYAVELDAAEARWKEAAQKLRGVAVATYHQEFEYLARETGIEIVGHVELKPGVPPTPAHIVELVDALRAKQARLVLTAAWSNNRQVAQVAEQTGARVVELPVAVSSAKGADTWIGMMDQIHARLVDALAQPPRPR